MKIAVYAISKNEEEFVERARLCLRYGAAIIVMAFDEDGPLDVTLTLFRI